MNTAVVPLFEEDTNDLRDGLQVRDLHKPKIFCFIIEHVCMCVHVCACVYACVCVKFLIRNRLQTITKQVAYPSEMLGNTSISEFRVLWICA